MGRRNIAQIKLDNARLQAEVDFLLGRSDFDPRECAGCEDSENAPHARDCAKA